jgi:hypothetical protein
VREQMRGEGMPEHMRRDQVGPARPVEPARDERTSILPHLTASICSAFPFTPRA